MIVYLATNRRAGLKYVGATSLGLAKRQTEHRRRAGCNGKKTHTRFERAIREYGWEAFEWSILSDCQSTEEMLAEERRWVEELDTKNPKHGYNMTQGGCGILGHKFSDESRAKLSRAAKGRIKSEEERRKLSIANKGKRPSEAAIAASLVRGLTTEQRRAFGRANKGRKHIWSDERRTVNIASHKARYEHRNTKVPHADLPIVLTRRAAGESFASIAATYHTGASNLFVWLKRRVSS